MTKDGGATKPCNVFFFRGGFLDGHREIYGGKIQSIGNSNYLINFFFISIFPTSIQLAIDFSPSHLS
jgi:hypothetical protein